MAAPNTLDRARKRLAEFVALEGWSQTRVADLCGVTQSSVSGWINGPSRPESHHRKVIAQLVGIQEEDWLKPDERVAMNKALREIAKTGTGG
jgi:transcriptional regulator with XRE-family HTH domain